MVPDPHADAHIIIDLRPQVPQLALYLEVGEGLACDKYLPDNGDPDRAGVLVLPDLHTI
jgi:hypothetical protein